MALFILLTMATALVALWLAGRANRRSSDERAVADSRATLERLGDIVTSVRRDEVRRPEGTTAGEPARADEVGRQAEPSRPYVSPPRATSPRRRRSAATRWPHPAR
jgi:hypothetical protein